jgi:hypothetical protein
MAWWHVACWSTVNSIHASNANKVKLQESRDGMKAAMRHPEPRWRPPALALSTPIGQRYKSTQLTRRMVTVAISSEIM